jgi:hypothetical protein
VYRLEPLSLLRSILVWDGADEVVAPTVLVTPPNLIVTALRDVLVPNRYGRGGVPPVGPLARQWLRRSAQPSLLPCAGGRTCAL